MLHPLFSYRFNRKYAISDDFCCAADFGYGMMDSTNIGKTYFL